jgi:hypothetical protein
LDETAASGQPEGLHLQGPPCLNVRLAYSRQQCLPRDCSSPWHCTLANLAVCVLILIRSPGDASVPIKAWSLPSAWDMAGDQRRSSSTLTSVGQQPDAASYQAHHPPPEPGSSSPSSGQAELACDAGVIHAKVCMCACQGSATGKCTLKVCCLCYEICKGQPGFSPACTEVVAEMTPHPLSVAKGAQDP